MVTCLGEKIRWFFRKSLIVMGDLPEWKNTKIFQKGSHCNEWPIQVNKYKDFSGGANSHWWCAQVKIFSKSEKFSKVFSIRGGFPFNGSCQRFLLQNTLFNVLKLDDMHASLPNLKYMPQFLLDLLVAWLVRTCYFWFGSSLSFGFWPTRVGSCKSFPEYLQFYTAQPLWCPSWPIYSLEILYFIDHFERIIH